MKKPKPVTRRPSLDYHECRDYIHKKYNVHTTNWAGWTPCDDSKPYQNLWHKLIDDCPNIGKGTYFQIHDEIVDYYLKECPVDDEGTDQKWIGEVYKLFFNEFGEYADEEGFLEFWVDW